jgi:hypothetical protein
METRRQPFGSRQSDTSRERRRWLAETFVVEGRITNALGRLRDRGAVLEDDMADMRVLVPELVADLLKECSSEWQAALEGGVNDKQIRSAVTKTLGTVYRRMLIARASS